ncbi:MFS general substrate transporter [Cylindrobasidium torrendii FP15055 ss-10]|uniref:MFS general substrate transporter n=1 Tax=Cylindrobasidium torrendii FP15055 ss-10 TaxID=1314674 RepID=A0A0D7BAL4_9AGAR|nr:MFS general substrate transporter [Cylindrobasidium torrendii FP15055 ss-10]
MDPSPASDSHRASSLHTVSDATRSGDGATISPTVTRRASVASTSTYIDQHAPSDAHELSTFRLLAIHFGAALTLFLATTDMNIVSTSLPTIAKELDASPTQYTWVGVAYLLTQTAFQPLYGRISDTVGRKVVLFTSVAIFALGSLVCGVSNTATMLIVARALAGVGGGGIVSSVWVITAEIVPIESRAKWSQALSITWSCSAIAGPLLGGAFSGTGTLNTGLSWRWGFYINLPICCLASLVLLVSLRGVTLQKVPDVSWKTIRDRFDFGGLFLFMGSTTSIIWGFSFANASEGGWKSATTLTTLILGSLGLIAAAVYESHTTRDCLFPPSAFRDRTAVVILFIIFVHNFVYSSSIFYLALFFQSVQGCTPLRAGILILPLSLGSSVASLPAAWFIGYWQGRKHTTSGQNMIISAGLLIATIGFGLLIILDEDASSAQQIVFPLICGIGLGLVLHAPHQVFVRTLRPEELATGTSAFFLVRFTGATVGLAVSGAILYARLGSLLPQGLDIAVGPGILEDLATLAAPQLRATVVDALSASIQTIWIACTPALGISFIISFLTKTYDIQTENMAHLTKTDTKSSSNETKV